MRRSLSIIDIFPSARILKLALVLLCSMAFSHQVHAQAAGTFADAPCDPDYFESLKSRAWLEAQREIVQNQNLIAKPDSVLEYSCFDQHMGVLASQASSMFSESTQWGSSGGTNLQGAVSGLTGASGASYLAANFNHPFLGGRMVGSSYNFNPSASGSSYSCGIMNQVWMYAKCMNLIDKAHDGFFTFEELQADDKRKLPTACGGGAPYQANINTALVAAQTPWAEDNMKTYIEIIYPEDGQCGDASSKIPTGMTVFTSQANNNLNEYAEHVCLVPGCHYVPSGANAGECVR